MKIQIFIASSLELKPERQELAYLVSQLNAFFEDYDIYIRIVKWEYVDSSMSSRHKQEDYNDELIKSDLCFFLFWKRLGLYTQEELNLAYRREVYYSKLFHSYYLFKETGEEMSMELLQFRQEKESRQIDDCFHFSTMLKLKVLVTMKILQCIANEVGNKREIKEHDNELINLIESIVSELAKCDTPTEFSSLISHIKTN